MIPRYDHTSSFYVNKIRQPQKVFLSIKKLSQKTRLKACKEKLFKIGLRLGREHCSGYHVKQWLKKIVHSSKEQKTVLGFDS